jgi:hypothetical protein
MSGLYEGHDMIGYRSLASVFLLCACATEAVTPSTPLPAETAVASTVPQVSEERAENCAAHILAVGGLARGQTQGPGRLMFERSQAAYGIAASWVTYYRASDPVEGIEAVLAQQTEETQARARDLVQEWSAAAEEGTPLEASMQPAIECIAQFSAVGLPPALPGM